jgi:GNAT superfamily N-acetyltransferase
VDSSRTQPIGCETRECRKDDFPAAFTLLGQLWPDKELDLQSLQSTFERGLASSTQAYLCAVSGGHVVGFASLTVKNNLWQAGYIGHVDELVVDEAHRNKGIGAKLLEDIAALARVKGCKRLELDSAHHRKEAHEFYERHGFENRALLFSRPL